MQNRIHLVTIFAAALALAGCGRKEAQAQAERDKQRVLAEEQAQREIQKSNEAVNEVSKKLGRKPPAMDIGVPVEKKATTPAPVTEPTVKK